MAFDLENLRSCLRLREVEDSVWEGANLALDYRRVFGGQILGQTVQALAAAAGPQRRLKSLFQRFPREGDVAKPIRYTVDKRQEGRSFSSYDVSAEQDGKLISTAAASLHVPESGYEWQTAAPSGRPEDATPLALDMVPWEVRAVDGVDLNARGHRAPVYGFWMRVPPLEADDWTHQALLAYATDLTVIGTGLQAVEGVSQADTGSLFHSAVTTHALWFHRPYRMDAWVLVDQHSPILSGGRVFGRGDIWTEDGALVASFAQEAMVRLLPPT